MHAFRIATASFFLVAVCISPILASGDMGGGKSSGVPSGPTPDYSGIQQEAWLNGANNFLNSNPPNIILAAAPGSPTTGRRLPYQPKGMSATQAESILRGESYTDVLPATKKWPTGGVVKYSQGGVTSHFGVVIGYNMAGDPIILESGGKGVQSTVGLPQTPSQAAGYTDTKPYIVEGVLKPPNPITQATADKIAKDAVAGNTNKIKTKICFDFAVDMTRAMRSSSTTTPTSTGP
jgi:hypothetical protein